MTAPVMIAAGGTGGHVYPALAVAAVLRGWDIPVVWLGTRGGLEADVVPAAGIELDYLEIGGLRGKGWRTRVAAPLQLLRAAWQASRILGRRRPRALLGMGGFAAGPGGLVARLRGCPLVIHEQNAVAGMTNRILARLANRVLEAIPNTFGPRARPQACGNPVRAEIAALPPPSERFAERSGPLRVLVLGGSQGARWLNEQLPAAFGRLPAAQQPVIRHAAGRRNLDAARAAYTAAGVEARVEPYIDDMADALGWADAVIARSGAMTVAEIAAVGIGALFIPFPHAVDDHQTRNAEWLVAAGAARVLAESEADPARLAEELDQLLSDRASLADRAQRARGLAQPDAAETVAQTLLEAAR